MTEFQPKPQTHEEVADGLRDAFRQAIKDGVMDATPYLKQMTYKSDIEKTEAEIAVLQKKLELLKEIETHKSQPKMTFDFGGKFEFVSYNDEEYLRLQFNDESHNWFKKKHTVDGMMLAVIMDGETRRLLEGIWYNDVKRGKYDEPYYIDDPECCSGIEWDRKDNPKPVDEVINRMVEECNSKKLWNILKDKWGFPEDACGDIVEAVAEWLPKEQSASGSQNTFVEEIVEGYNDCLREMKEMLR